MADDEEEFSEVCVCDHVMDEHERGFFNKCAVCNCSDYEEKEKRPPPARRQLVSSDEAEQAVGQHKLPCADCPWARKAMNGWLGSTSVEQWVQDAHGEVRIECHTLLGAQCAGAAIYRANVCKSVRDPDVLKLKPNRELVFGTPKEFREHHAKLPSLKTAKKRARK